LTTSLDAEGRPGLEDEAVQADKVRRIGVSKRRVVLIAAGLSLLYLLIQAVYISRLPLVMDEFDGANEAYQLLDLTPYKDYRPYKTVLGYYLQLPPLLFTSDPWTGLMLSKSWLALINTAAIFAATLALAAIFSPAAAIAGQVLLIFVTTFLERSSEIRVDMLTAWVGLASFVLLLKQRWLLAGLVAGLSFLVSQKGVYYIVAASAAAGLFWLIEARDRRSFRNLILLNIAAVSVIAVYIALWGIVSTPESVFRATFLSHGDIAFAQLYENLEQHWTRTLVRNPLFYGGALAGIGALVLARWSGKVGGTHLMTAAYAAVVFALCRWHKQPWPYFFVILIPTLMVVHVAVADVVWRRPKWRPIGAALIVLAGVGWPLLYMPGIIERDHRYQRHVIRFAHAMLDETDPYLAGNDLIYNRRQAPAGLRRLSAPRLEAMRQWPPEPVDALIADVEKARPKLVIEDARMRLLHPRLRAHLATRFDLLWSSVSGYAPLVATHERQFDLWFDGEYRVEPESGDAVIDGIRYAAGTLITLPRGLHRNESAAPVRLRLEPRDLASRRDPAMQSRRLMFVRAYDY
jgi:hypothetical protein